MTPCSGCASRRTRRAAVHQHDEACYDENGLLVCGKADFVLHTHDADTCYDAEGNLICTLPEITAYSRTTLFLAKAEDSATATTSSSLQFDLFIPEGAEDTDSTLPDGYVVLDSQEPEAWTEAHTHSADCYDENGKLICGQLEVAQHQHTMDCLQGTLICGLEEHQHSQACYTDAQNADQTDQQALTAQVDDATIGVTFPADALPEGVILQAREIAQDSDDYAVYYQQALQAMQNQSETEVTLSFARFFDIAFLADGTEVEPAAPVDVTITYADGIALADNENSSAIHFTDDDIQVLEVQTEGVGDIVDTFTFTQDSFSVTGTVVALSASSAEAQELEVLVGETIAITGASANYHSWTSSDKAIATVTAVPDSNEKANVTGMKAGTVTITHQYWNKNNKKDMQSEEFTVTVVEAMKEAAGANFTVKVTGNKNVLPEGVALMVEEVDASYEDDAYYNAMIDKLNAAGAATTTLQSGSDHAATDFDFLHMYHIWLQQADGEEYVLDENENENLNLNVTITYTEAPAGWNSLQANGAWVGHYKKENGAIAPKSIDGSFEPKQVKVKGSSISFHMKSFSVITMATAAAATIDDTGTDTVIPDYADTPSTATAKNDWQVAAQNYIGSGLLYTYSSDDAVRIRKTVEATGTENEFKIHLTVEPEANDFQSFLDLATFIAVHNNSTDIGGNLNTSSGYSPLYSETEYQKQNSPSSWSKVQITMLFDGISYTTYKYIDGDKISEVNNGGVGLWVSDVDEDGNADRDETVCLTKKSTVSWAESTSDRYTNTIDLTNGGTIDLADYITVTRNVTIPTLVTDPMGPGITYTGGCVVSAGTVTEPSDANGNTLIWKLPTTAYANASKKVAATGNGSGHIYYKNAYTLEYTIKLTDYESCGLDDGKPDKTKNRVATNGTTTLTYRVDTEKSGKEIGTTTGDTETVNFAIPQVVGLKYELKLKKVDSTDETKLLQGAEFTLYAKANETETDETEADETEARTVLYEGLKSDADGILCYAVEGENPVNSFPLQTGTYYLEETKAPDGYHMLTEPVVITINEKGVSAMCGTAQLTVEAPSQGETSSQEDTSSQDTETTVYTVLVTNSSGTALPETGGSGPEAYQLAGLLLMLIAAGWLWQRLRERGNAHSPKA